MPAKILPHLKVKCSNEEKKGACSSPISMADCSYTECRCGESGELSFEFSTN
jgi:hypothetical protein